MRALDRKLLRELGRMRGQVVTIALVVACGIAVYVSMVGTYRALEDARADYYAEHRFADVFAQLERAPIALAADILEIPGVAEVETRIVENVLVDLPDIPEPGVGRLVSIPSRGEPRLNRHYLRSGRTVAPGRLDEALAVESFVTANALRPGDSVSVVHDGRRMSLRISGVALSPEYVATILGGDFWGDERRAAVLWVDRDALAAATGMEGAFNDVAVRLSRGVAPDGVIDAIDRLLEPYGGLGAYGRDEQMADRFVSNELSQLRIQARVVPVIFLAVAAFLLNIVLSRLVGTQREQIASLKALGYSGRRIGIHYVELAAVIITLGAIAGTLLGSWLGDMMTELYSAYFRFPRLEFTLAAADALVAIGVSAGSALIGSASVVARVAALPPAEGMRAEAPPVYRPTLIERLAIAQRLPGPVRMILREIERRPLRMFTSVVGISLAAVILVSGLFWMDALDYFMEIQFRVADRSDVTVSFAKPVPYETYRTLERLDGVLLAEPTRTVPVQVRSGHRSRKTAIMALEEGAQLRRIVGQDAVPQRAPPRGLQLSSALANALDVGPGDRVEVAFLEGERRVRRATVVATVDEMVGNMAYARLDTLAEMLREEPAINGAMLSVERPQEESVLRALKAMPFVAGAGRRSEVIERFNESTGEQIWVMTMILAIFAAVIAVGIVYNAARIAVAERSRDLATMRVLGFTRREISAILIGEVGVQITLAIPIGLYLGKLLAEWLAVVYVDPELFRMPAIIGFATYAFAVGVVAASGVVSALAVRRRLDRLDLLAVLKAAD